MKSCAAIFVGSMDQNLFEQLLYRGESETLDFKVGQYAFEKATDEEKSELLKDIPICPRCPSFLEEARRIVGEFVEHYNQPTSKRPGLVPPADRMAGRQNEICQADPC